MRCVRSALHVHFILSAFGIYDSFVGDIILAIFPIGALKGFQLDGGNRSQ